jgi:hypothetical protein
MASESAELPLNIVNQPSESRREVMSLDPGNLLVRTLIRPNSATTIQCPAERKYSYPCISTRAYSARCIAEKQASGFQ